MGMPHLEKIIWFNTTVSICVSLVVILFTITVHSKNSLLFIVIKNYWVNNIKFNSKFIEPLKCKKNKLNNTKNLKKIFRLNENSSSTEKK